MVTDIAAVHSGVMRTVRRMGCFQFVKNCFMTEENHARLLSRALNLWPAVLEPVVGPEPFMHGESEYKGIWPEGAVVNNELRETWKW